MLGSVDRTVLEMPFTHNGHTQTAPVELYTPVNAFLDNPDLPLVFPGMGNEGIYARRLTKILDGLDFPAVTVVFHFPNAEAVDPVCVNGVEFVASKVNRILGLDKDTPKDTISHSQSGGIVLISGKHTPQLADARHSVIAPVGLNSYQMGPEGNTRKKEFWKRFLLENPRQEGQLHPSGWSVGAGVFGRFISDTAGSFIRNGYNLLPKKLEYAISDRSSRNAIQGLSQMTVSSATALFVGENDPVFRFVEIEETLSSNGMEEKVRLDSVAGAHEPLVCRLGRLQLSAAIDHIRKNN